MTREEFIKGLADLNEQAKQLRRDYIASNVKNNAKCFVTVNGERMWLEKCTVVGYHIQPLLYTLTRNGTKNVYKRYYPKEPDIWKKMKYCKDQKPIKTKNDEK